MSEKRIDGFFYGLFMDRTILRELGVQPENPRHAFIEDYRLSIGDRATLLPCPNARAYGMVLALTAVELGRLYSGPGLEEYQPETIIVTTFTGEAIQAICYNLVGRAEQGQMNSQYAVELAMTLKKLGFPADYILEIEP